MSRKPRHKAPPKPQSKLNESVEIEHFEYPDLVRPHAGLETVSEHGSEHGSDEEFGTPRSVDEDAGEDAEADPRPLAKADPRPLAKAEPRPLAEADLKSILRDSVTSIRNKLDLNPDSPWVQYFDDKTKKHYYHNGTTEETTWKIPAEGISGRERRHDDEERDFLYKELTKLNENTERILETVDPNVTGFEIVDPKVIEFLRMGLSSSLEVVSDPSVGDDVSAGVLRVLDDTLYELLKSEKIRAKCNARHASIYDYTAQKIGDTTFLEERLLDYSVIEAINKEELKVLLEWFRHPPRQPRATSTKHVRTAEGVAKDSAEAEADAEAHRQRTADKHIKNILIIAEVAMKSPMDGMQVIVDEEEQIQSIVWPATEPPHQLDGPSQPRVQRPRDVMSSRWGNLPVHTRQIYMLRILYSDPRQTQIQGFFKTAEFLKELLKIRPDQALFLAEITNASIPYKTETVDFHKQDESDKLGITFYGEVVTKVEAGSLAFNKNVRPGMTLRKLYKNGHEVSGTGAEFLNTIGSSTGKLEMIFECPVENSPSTTEGVIIGLKKLCGTFGISMVAQEQLSDSPDDTLISDSPDDTLIYTLFTRLLDYAVLKTTEFEPQLIHLPIYRKYLLDGGLLERDLKLLRKFIMRRFEVGQVRFKMSYIKTYCLQRNIIFGQSDTKEKLVEYLITHSDGTKVSINNLLKDTKLEGYESEYQRKKSEGNFSDAEGETIEDDADFGEFESDLNDIEVVLDKYEETEKISVKTLLDQQDKLGDVLMKFKEIHLSSAVVPEQGNKIVRFIWWVCRQFRNVFRLLCKLCTYIKDLIVNVWENRDIATHNLSIFFQEYTVQLAIASANQGYAMIAAQLGARRLSASRSSSGRSVEEEASSEQDETSSEQDEEFSEQKEAFSELLQLTDSSNITALRESHESESRGSSSISALFGWIWEKIKGGLTAITNFFLSHFNGILLAFKIYINLHNPLIALRSIAICYIYSKPSDPSDPSGLMIFNDSYLVKMLRISLNPSSIGTYLKQITNNICSRGTCMDHSQGSNFPPASQGYKFRHVSQDGRGKKKTRKKTRKKHVRKGKI